MSKNCIYCSKPIKGRSDKKFCSVACKNAHHYQHKRNTVDEVKEVDSYLHRNREILCMLMGDSLKETFDRIILVRAHFRWEYMTGIYKSKQGKYYYLVYDFAWAELGSQQIMVVRKANKTTEQVGYKP